MDISQLGMVSGSAVQPHPQPQRKIFDRTHATANFAVYLKPHKIPFLYRNKLSKYQFSIKTYLHPLRACFDMHFAPRRPNWTKLRQ